MLISADQLLCHVIGDYLIQSDWMASEKTKKSLAALAHAVSYTLPFFFLTLSWKALLFIAGTHFIIDRWRLARYLVWLKNFLAPEWIKVEGEMVMPLKMGSVQFALGSATGWKQKYIRNKSWKECSATGYDPAKPAWMSVWLMIIADNILHVICNGTALRWLVG